MTPPKDASVTKDLRKIAVLRSKRNEKATKKAGEIVANLKTRFKTVSEIAREASDDKKAVYRLLSPPKKRIKDEMKLSRKLTNEIKEEVEGMYNDEEISYCLPDMNLAKKRFMACTIHEAHQKYIRKSTTKRQVAEKTFAALRPKEVKTVQDTPLRLCLCEYCANFNKTRETLIGMGIKGIPRNHSACIEKTLCNFRSEQGNKDDVRNPKLRNEFPAKKCVKRMCPKCGIRNYQDSIFSMNAVKIRQLTRIMWQQWEKVPYVVSGKKKTKTCLVTNHSSMAKLLALFFNQLKEIAMHQFQQLWQLRNFNLPLRNLQKGQVLFIHNFQMNLMLFAPDEPSGVHWDQPQLTVHPTSVFY